MERDTRDEQFWNAEAPMDVTLSGMERDTRDEQFWNAEAPMDVTLSGIVISEHLVLLRYQGVYWDLDSYPHPSPVPGVNTTEAMFVHPAKTGSDVFGPT